VRIVRVVHIVQTACAAFVTRRRFVAGCAVVVAALVVCARIAVPPVSADTVPVGSGEPTRIVRLTSYGFAANENVSLWITAPDRAVTPLDTAQTDSSGTLTVSLIVGSDGTWLVTARGLTSKREVVTRHIVGAESTESPDKATVITATVVTTPAATVGQAVTVAGEGMNAGEPLSMWLTSPLGAVSPLSSLQAERNGQFAVKVTFATQGYWQVTTKGRDSGREIVRGYRVGDLAPLVTPTVTPALVTPAAAMPPTVQPVVTVAPTAVGTATPNAVATFFAGGAAQPATVVSTAQP